MGAHRSLEVNDAKINADYYSHARAQDFRPPLFPPNGTISIFTALSSRNPAAAGRYCAPDIDQQYQYTLQEEANLIEENQVRDSTLPAGNVRLQIGG
jgi:hypothetical protein